MTVSNNLLANVKSQSRFSQPYPYLFQPGCLEQNYVDQLVEQFPPIELLAGKNVGLNNFRFNYNAETVLKSDKIPSIWVDFIRENSSPSFFHNFIDLFKEELVQRYPQVGRTAEEWKALKVGIRHLNNFSTHDVLLDAQIGGNTPVKIESAVRSRHIDDTRKLFGGLYYLRLSGDNSQGGDLEISGPRGNKFRFFNNVYVKDEYAKTHAVVPYQRNNFVMFLNSPLSWHGVSPREITHHPRLFVNFIAEMKEPLFNVDKQQDKVDLWMRKLRLRKYSKYET
jgi:hypothetical protein